MDALTTCNSCDAAPMSEGDPRGYCAACGLDAAQATMERAKRHRDAVASRLTAAWDRDEKDLDVLAQLRADVASANGVLDKARDGVRRAAR